MMNQSKCAFLLLLALPFFTFNAAAQGITKYGQITVTSTNFVDLNGRIGSNPALDQRGSIIYLPCSTFAVTHTAGTVAPVTKTVTYGVVRTSLSGASKCWITRNLGADNQATSATDGTEASAGWYWQFNRQQGYKHDGTTRTPATWDNTSDNLSATWEAAKDPCTLLLGTGWRIPTSTEWTSANTTGGWANYTDTYASVLKLHAAGCLSGGSLGYRGTTGYNWSSTQYNDTYGWYLYVSSSSIHRYNNDKASGYTVRCLGDNSPAFSCGNPLAVTHTAGTVAPVTKTVAYGTVTSSLSGASKCWITQNLGADNQASSAQDGTEPSAGWYWQFNRKQGYKNDGATVTPAWTITSITETSDWLPANDPCTLELGTGWRIPTSTEWTNADATGAWTSYTNTYASVLKLHAAGFLLTSGGSLDSRGTGGYYWSSTQGDATNGWYLAFVSSFSDMYYNSKAYGFALRCLKDDAAPVFSCGYALTVTHWLNGDGVTPVTKTVSYGTVTTSLSGASKCWITQNLGADNQAGTATDATDASAGWYWQFNRKQGFSIFSNWTPSVPGDDVCTPGTAWNGAAYTESSDWLPDNDPCTLLLGTGWRIPTSTEWTSADANGQTGGWDNYTEAFTDVLKLHAAGFLNTSNGSLGARASGNYWSSTQYNSTTGWRLYFTSGNSGMLSNGKAAGNSLRCLGDNTAPFSCGNGLAVIHTAGAVAPVAKNIVYGTVQTSLSGAGKCWITRNLGAATQATAADDATEASAGWYWQFNRAQGYKHDGATRTPATAWITSIYDESDWLPANDPCTLELGTGWRIPTNTEWTNANTTGSWANLDDTYASVLKLHTAGYLGNSTDGQLDTRGTYGFYWSSTQSNATKGWYLNFVNSSDMGDNDKTFGFSVRCLKDAPTFSCGDAFFVSHTAGAVAPVMRNIVYGTVQTSLSGASKCWITQNLGADQQATVANDGTEASAGWYWQFNRKQGFKHDGATRTPATVWITSISETSDWLPANDPCTLELGTGWRIPTSMEWTNVDAIPQDWANYIQAYNSVLKLHAAGNLDVSTGALNSRGSDSNYWSSTQSNATDGYILYMSSLDSDMYNYPKTYGLSVRCLKD